MTQPFILLLLLVCFIISGCDNLLPASEQEIKSTFTKAVNQSNHCEEDSQCILINPGCPLGCNRAINQTYQTKLEKKAKDLINRYEMMGSSCKYKCIKEYAICYDNRCQSNAF